MLYLELHQDYSLNYTAMSKHKRVEPPHELTIPLEDAKESTFAWQDLSLSLEQKMEEMVEEEQLDSVVTLSHAFTVPLEDFQYVVQDCLRVESNTARAYLGIKADSEGQKRLVIYFVATKKVGDLYVDILPDEGYIYDISHPCPPTCVNSALIEIGYKKIE